MIYKKKPQDSKLKKLELQFNGKTNPADYGKKTRKSKYQGISFFLNIFLCQLRYEFQWGKDDL